MSYSSEVKEELCGVPIESDCDALAELFGILLFANQFSTREIRISTSNTGVRDRILYLSRRCFSFEIPYVQQTRKYSFSVTELNALHRILLAFGIDPIKNVSIRLNRAILEEDCCRSAFLRGAFLMGGSASDPEKSYHLELVTSHYNLSREMMALLMDMEFDPKITVRKSNYVLYFKYSEGIEDFLTKIGAPISAMKMMTAKVEKEVRNQVNRQVNCETANITKTIDAAMIQIRAIEQIKNTIGFDALPEELRVVAEARLENPELSLSMLAETMNPPLRKATLNYRLKKLIALGTSD